MMNRLSFLLFVFAFSLAMMNCSAYSSTIYTRTVWIRNSLHNGNDLIVHCRSGSGDMGYHRVHPTGLYNFFYKESASFGELFWCRLWQGPNFKHHQVFRVHDEDIWEAREDGIYLSKNLGPYGFVSAWDAPLNVSTSSSLRSSCISLSLLLVSSLFLFSSI